MNQYQKKYGTSKILKIDNDLNSSLTTPDQQASDLVHVFVTSNKELKLNAAEQLLKKNPRFSNSKLIVTGFKSSSNIAEQPISIESGERGAKNRIESTKQSKSFKEFFEKNNPKCYIFVSIENYFSSPKNGALYDHAFVIVENEFQTVFKYVSDGVEMNKDFYDEALSKGGEYDETGLNITLGEIFHSKYPEIPASDWHAHVTKTESFPGISRTEQILTCYKNKNF